jgi:excinuclease ABC subunit A
LTEQLKTRLFDLRKAGFNRLYQAGQVFEFSTPESLLDVDFNQPVFVLVDRLTVSAEGRSRIVDAVETAYRESGEVIFDLPERGDQPAAAVAVLSALRMQALQRAYEEPEPRLFSFNNPYGACPRCQGFGNTIDFDLDLVIPDKTKTLAEGAIDPWNKPKYRPLFTEMKRLPSNPEFRWTCPGVSSKRSSRN